MPKTFLDIRNALAGMVGFDAYSDLTTRDQADVDTIANAAYMECYAERNGRRPRWIEQYVSEIAKAPAEATLGLTNGSKTVTGFSFETKYAGSFVRIDGKFYRYGGTVDGVHSLVQPWAGTTGSYAATVYYNAIVLPGTVIEVCESPSLLGIGPLTPMPAPETEIGLRSAPAFDFSPRPGRAPFAVSRPRFDASLFTDVGDPAHYHIDQASTGATFSSKAKFCLYPIPGQTVTLELRADIIPAPMTADADVPVMPGETADITGAILLPIAYDLLLKHPLGRRYAGNNAQLILAGANDARAQLRTTFARVQRRVVKQVRSSPDW